MPMARILLQNANFGDVWEGTLRQFLTVNDYAHSERRDFCNRLRAAQRTPNEPPEPMQEMVPIGGGWDIYYVSLLV